MVDRPRIGIPVQLHHRLDQAVLKRIKMTVRNTLSTIAHVQGQQVACLYLVADPVREFRQGQVVWEASKTSNSSVRRRCMSESGEGIGARSGETAGSRYAATAGTSGRESSVLATTRMGVVTGC